MIKKQVHDFRDFIRDQGVVGLAVGFVLGGAVAKLVSAFVVDVVNPIIGMVIGSTRGLDLVVLKLGKTNVLIGNFLGALVDFIVLACVIYFTFKWLRLDKLTKPKDDKEKEEEILKKVKKSM